MINQGHAGNDGPGLGCIRSHLPQEVQGRGVGQVDRVRAKAIDANNYNMIYGTSGASRISLGCLGRGRGYRIGRFEGRRGDGKSAKGKGKEWL